MLRRQSKDTYQNIKRSVYCQYGYYSLAFRALALRQRETKTDFETETDFRRIRDLETIRAAKTLHNLVNTPY